MSTIDRLVVRGIRYTRIIQSNLVITNNRIPIIALDALSLLLTRSFDPESRNVIEFYTPLTLLVGDNGCGKTTIIECLKYATTGELPPNSKQGAFINDPKISDRAEIKAQVKLLFKNLLGKSMVCTRSISLTQKKASRTQKTLESLLLTKDEFGNQISVSSKCSELDAELPHQLGVSTSILDNVIFCHQEESLWPLSEPLVLKKKFDEIFAATKFTKALDSIKSLRKENATDLKINTSLLEQLKRDKERAVKVRILAQTAENKISRAKTRINELDNGEIEEIQTSIEELNVEERKIQELKSRIDKLSHERSVLQQNLNSLRASMTLYEMSDSKLEKMLEEVSLKNMARSQDMIMLMQEKQRLQEEISAIQIMQSEKLTLSGQLRAEAMAHQEAIKTQKQLVLLISEQNDIPVPLNSSQEITYFIAQINQILIQKQQLLSDFRTKAKRRENILTQDVQKLSTSIATLQDSKKIANRQIDFRKSKISTLEKQLSVIRDVQSEIETLKMHIISDENEISKLNEENESSLYERNMGEKLSELRTVDDELVQMSNEMRVLNLNAGTRAKLSLKNAELSNNELKLNEIIGSMQQSSQKLFGKIVTVDRYAIDISALERIKADSLKKTQEDASLVDTELANVNATLIHASTLFDAKTIELKTNLKIVQDVCGDDPFDVVLKHCTESVTEGTTNMASLESTSVLYSKFIKAAEKSGCCALCKRDFDGDDEIDLFINDLQKTCDRIPERIKIAEKELLSSEKRLKEVEMVRSSFSTCERIQKTEIPDLERQKQIFSNEKDNLEAEKTKIQGQLLQHTAMMNDIYSFKQKISQYESLLAIQRQLEAEIHDITSELSVLGSTKTLEDAQRDYQSAQRRSKLLREEIESMNADLRKKQDNIRNKESRLQDLKRNLQDAENRAKEKMQLKVALEDSNRELVELKKTIDENDDKSQIYLREFELKGVELNMLQQEIARDEQVLIEKLQFVQDGVHRINTSNQQIEVYASKRIEDKLKECAEILKEIEQRILENNVKLNSIADLQRESDKQVSETSLLERDIQDNQKARQSSREIICLDDKLEELKAALLRFDHKSIRTKYSELQKRYDELVGERAGLIGELKQLEVQHRSLLLELNSEFKDVENQYAEMYKKLSTETCTNQDLEIYVKALDQAIMKYHTLKMEEINKIIKSLWQSTYKGEDIESIEIRADHEKVTTARSYNYRVVMIKPDGVSLDMRGRCSAGQKVLTSIIIRLALAETFGSHCGILALDEPTTNLDKANIDSLADSLIEIIRKRRTQKNFQLIVITHDHSFLEKLGKSEFADYYFRVYKNEHGFSEIERQDLAGLE